MTIRPLVSILIPAYNSQEWIADTLRSAIGQTWERKEIIVVDDGSTDQTLTVARKFESRCVRVISTRNQGAAAARNTAFSLSNGDYIQWLDADDLLSPEKIAMQMAFVEHSAGKRTLLSCPWGRFIYRHYRTEFSPTSLWCDLSPAEWLMRKIGENVFMSNATWLVSRKLTEVAGPWDTTMHVDDDGEYFCRILLASDGVCFVPDAKVYYRASGSGRLSYVGRSNLKLEGLWRSMQLHVGYLRTLEDSERARSACLRYLQTDLVYFYPARFDIVKEIQQLAKNLGGDIKVPQLSWKYSWIKSLFGWDMANRAQTCLPRIRWSIARTWDKFLCGIESGVTNNQTLFEKEQSALPKS